MTPDQENLPDHIAIIMDGNGRWARQQGLPTKSGHRHGAEAARDIVNACVERHIPFLTLFAFSSENWMRPEAEVEGLMALFLSVLKRKEISQLHKKNVRLRFIGKRTEFAPTLLKSMEEVEQLTAGNTGTTLTVAADYGGRWDITQAAVALAAKVETGQLKSADITAETLHSQTSLRDIPDPDLCIRTGGEQRVSNFLLWQFAYTELYFTECFWPDFGVAEFDAALEDYASRQRRFGGHGDEVTANE